VQHKLPFDSKQESRILTKSFLLELIKDNGLISNSTFAETSLNFPSYDVRVGSRVVFSGSGEIKELRENDTFPIPAGAYVGIVSRENFNLPENVIGIIGTKRRFSYEGLILLTGFIVDAGYQGHLLFTVYNASNKPSFLQFEEKLCTVIFHQVEGYCGRKFHDSSLLEGKFPSEFVRNIGQTDPSGYASLQDEVKKIQDISGRISRLETEYNDVRGPIKDLTKLVENVTKELQEVKSISQQNTLNIKDLTDTAKRTKESVDSQARQIGKSETDISWLKWGIMALLGSLALYWIVNALLPLIKHNSAP
jgi:deoxycytidine triphosphate deaminase